MILGIVFALVAIVTLIVGLAYLTTVIPPVTSVSSETVAHSLSAEVGASWGECRDIRPGVRECDVFDAATSGSVTYRVQMDSWRCWTAVRIGGIGSLSDRAHSCAHLNDQIGLSL